LFTKRAAACGSILTALAVLLVAPPAWASGGGAASESPTHLLNSAIAAQRQATSFNVSGTIQQGSQTIGMNVTASGAGNGFGTITLNGQKVQIVRIGKTVYFRAGRSFWQSQGGSAAASVLANRWVSGPSNNADFKDLASFFDSSWLSSQLVPPGTVTSGLTKGGTTTISGTKVIVLKGAGSTGKGLGSIYIAASGPPYIVRITLPAGKNSGSVTFSRFNASVHPTAPANSIGVGALSS